MPLSDRWTIPVGTAAGSPFNSIEYIRSLRIDSNSCWVTFPQYGIVLPPGVLGHILNLPRATQDLDISTVTPAGQTAGTGGIAALVVGYSRWQTNSPGMWTSGYGGPTSGGGGGGNVTIVAPIGENLEANSVSVTLATDEEAIPVNATIVAPIGENVEANAVTVTLASDEETIGVSQGLGSANVNTGTLVTGAAATLVVARPTRVGVTIFNRDAAGGNTVYIGPATVTAANGVAIPPQTSRTVTWVGLIQALAGSGTPTVDFWEEYN